MPVSVWDALSTALLAPCIERRMANGTGLAMLLASTGASISYAQEVWIEFELVIAAVNPMHTVLVHHP